MSCIFTSAGWNILETFLPGGENAIISYLLKNICAVLSFTTQINLTAVNAKSIHIGREFKAATQTT